MTAPYRKGDLEIANAELDKARRNYSKAESALAVARHDLSIAERHASDRFHALCEASEVRSTALPVERCPTCGHKDGSSYKCSDPWHGDDHLRRKNTAQPSPSVAVKEG